MQIYILVRVQESWPIGCISCFTESFSEPSSVIGPMMVYKAADNRAVMVKARYKLMGPLLWNVLVPQTNHDLAILSYHF